MTDLINRLRSVWPQELPADTPRQRHAVIEMQALKKEAAMEIERLRAAIAKTLNENGHLADGDNCTLIALKRAVPDWELPE
jgi:hypothetical protein